MMNVWCPKCGKTIADTPDVCWRCVEKAVRAGPFKANVAPDVEQSEAARKWVELLRWCALRDGLGPPDLRLAGFPAINPLRSTTEAVTPEVAALRVFEACGGRIPDHGEPLMLWSAAVRQLTLFLTPEDKAHE